MLRRLNRPGAVGRPGLEVLADVGEWPLSGQEGSRTTPLARIGSPEDRNGAPWDPGTREFPAAGQRSTGEGRAAIEVIDCYKTFGTNRVMNGLNLWFPEGKVTTVLGPSGTGKSVLIKHILGLMVPDAGDVRVFGQSIPNLDLPSLLELRKRFGVLFQDGALFGSMNVYDNVAFPLRQHTELPEDAIREIVTRRLKEVGLEAAAFRLPNQISGGMRKRAGFARALVLNPDVLLFDEPDSGLDPVRTSLLNDLILKIHEEDGGTYVIVTHDISTARKVSDWIAIIWQGQAVFCGPAKEGFESEDPFVRQFLSGESAGPLGMD